MCVCVITRWFVFCQTVNSLPLPDSSVSTDYNQRLFSFVFFHSGLLCVLRVVGKQEDLYIKVFFEGEKKWCFLALSPVKINSAQPHLHVFSVIITVLFLFIHFLIILAAFFLLGDSLYAPRFHFITIIIFIWVCLKSCFLSVNLWDKWIGVLVGLFKIRGCLFVDFSFAFSKLHIFLVDH